MLVIPDRVKVIAVMVTALALAAGLLTLALLAKPAQAQAETITSNDRSTFNLVVVGSDPCENEEGDLHIQGTSHAIRHTTIDANGVPHTTFHFNIHGRGESESGAKYVYNEVFTVHAPNFPGGEPNPNGATTFTVTWTIKLIRQGSDTPTDDATAKFVLHSTINAQGELTSVVGRIEGGCT